MPKFIVLFVVALYPSLSFSASFDCARAATKMEKMVCGDSALSRSDENMAAAYAKALKETADPAAIKKQQREWLGSVQRCENTPCLLTAFQARIAQLASPENGLWTGTIGNQEVVACFFHFDLPQYSNESGYFYVRHAQRIALEPRRESSNVWSEGDSQSPTGIWKFNDRHGDLLLGTWSDVAGKKSVPIRLKRFKTLSMGDPGSFSDSCSPEYGILNAAMYARIQAAKVTVGKTQTANGKPYRTISALDGAVETLEMLDQSGAVAELNERLRNELTVGIREYHGCAAALDEQYGEGGEADYGATVKLAHWDEHRISFVRSIGGFCGGAHPFFESTYSTWDLTTGKEVNLLTWLEQDKAKRDIYDSGSFIPRQLDKIIAEAAVKERGEDETDDCLSVIRDNHSYQLSLGGQGLIFHSRFAHVVQACDFSIEIPYATLAPFMTKAGREAIAANH